VAIGISGDSASKQAKFRDKYQLNMPLLADTEKKVASKYGACMQKSLYGKLHLGIQRTTFIIDRDGFIKKIFPKVKLDGHVKEVLQELTSIG
jgi:peroxiredoxin Q/BCP